MATEGCELRAASCALHVTSAVTEGHHARLRRRRWRKAKAEAMVEAVTEGCCGGRLLVNYGEGKLRWRVLL